MRVGKIGERGSIRVVLQLQRDIVEQECEGAHPEGGDRIELGRQRIHVGGVRILDREPGREAVDELDAPGATGVDQFTQLIERRSLVR